MTTSERKIRFGVAGLGTVANDVLGVLGRHPNVEVTAGADIRQDGRDKFVSQFGGEAFASVEDMCKSPNVDAVYVITPNFLHADHAVIAAEHGKQVIVTKPMAITLADCDRMIAAGDSAGVRMLSGTTPAFTPVVMKMAELVKSGELGRLLMINTWWFTDWIYLPRMPEELDATKGGGVVFRQGPHQVDILRTIGGGLARSVKAVTSRAEPARPVEGSYSLFMSFENGAVGTAVYNGYSHFDTTELTGGINARGRVQDPTIHARILKESREFSGPEAEAAYKDSVRFGGTREGAWSQRQAEKAHEFYGLTLVSCERGDIRQSATGLVVYDDNGPRDVTFPVRSSELDAEVDEMYAAWSQDRPLSGHDIRWGKATLEVCLAMYTSAQEQREVPLLHQVAG